MAQLKAGSTVGGKPVVTTESDGKVLPAVLPAASNTTVGGVKVGPNLQIDGNNELSVNTSGFATNAGGVTGFQAGTFATMPAAGNLNRWYFATDTKKVYRDNGSAWVDMTFAPDYNDLTNKPMSAIVASLVFGG